MTTNARVRPVSGRWFEELPVGFTVEHVTRRTVTETDNVLFTTMTMNPAPMHLDADYASRSEFGRPLVNSMFTVALVVGLSVPELLLPTIGHRVPRLRVVEARRSIGGGADPRDPVIGRRFWIEPRPPRGTRSRAASLIPRPRGDHPCIHGRAGSGDAHARGQQAGQAGPAHGA